MQDKEEARAWAERMSEESKNFPLPTVRSRYAWTPSYKQAGTEYHQGAEGTSAHPRESSSMSAISEAHEDCTAGQESEDMPKVVAEVAPTSAHESVTEEPEANAADSNTVSTDTVVEADAQ